MDATADEDIYDSNFVDKNQTSDMYDKNEPVDLDTFFIGNNNNLINQDEVFNSYSRLEAIPIVYTTRLDDMNIFTRKNNKLTMEDASKFVLRESKPLFIELERKSASTKSQRNLTKIQEKIKLFNKNSMRRRKIIQNCINRLSLPVENLLDTNFILNNERTIMKCKRISIIVKALFKNKATLEIPAKERTQVSSEDNEPLICKNTVQLNPGVKKTYFEQLKSQYSEFLKNRVVKASNNCLLSLLEERNNNPQASITDELVPAIKPKMLFNHLENSSIIFKDIKLMKFQFFEINSQGMLISYFTFPWINGTVKVSNKLKVFSKTICCWVLREKTITDLIKLKFVNKAMPFLRRPHTCPFGNCRCCCKLKLNNRTKKRTIKLASISLPTHLSHTKKYSTSYKKPLTSNTPVMEVKYPNCIPYFYPPIRSTHIDDRLYQNSTPQVIPKPKSQTMTITKNIINVTSKPRKAKVCIKDNLIKTGHSYTKNMKKSIRPNSSPSTPISQNSDSGNKVNTGQSHSPKISPSTPNPQSSQIKLEPDEEINASQSHSLYSPKPSDDVVTSNESVNVDIAGVNDLISIVLKKFKDVKLKVNKEGKVTAEMKTPVSDFSRDDLKILATIINYFQKQVTELGLVPGFDLNKSILPSTVPLQFTPPLTENVQTNTVANLYPDIQQSHSILHNQLTKLRSVPGPALISSFTVPYQSAPYLKENIQVNTIHNPASENQQCHSVQESSNSDSPSHFYQCLTDISKEKSELYKKSFRDYCVHIMTKRRSTQTNFAPVIADVFSLQGTKNDVKTCTNKKSLTNIEEMKALNTLENTDTLSKVDSITTGVKRKLPEQLPVNAKIKTVAALTPCISNPVNLVLPAQSLSIPVTELPIGLPAVNVIPQIIPQHTLYNNQAANSAAFFMSTLTPLMGKNTVTNNGFAINTQPQSEILNVDDPRENDSLPGSIKISTYDLNALKSADSLKENNVNMVDVLVDTSEVDEECILGV